MQRKIDTISFVYYDNEKEYLHDKADLIQNGGTKFAHEIDTPFIYNFIDFKINDVNLTKYFHANFFDYNVGVLGSICKTYDDLLIKYLLQEPITIAQVENIIAKYHDNSRRSFIIGLFDEINRNEILIYSCRKCLDPGCGGIKIEINHDEDFYHWKFGEQLIFKFEKDQYRKTMNEYFDKFQKSLNPLQKVKLYMYNNNRLKRNSLNSKVRV